ncbi:haloacid dehalogenase-like hydrolase [Phytohabitans flavus]|uniref:Haloacid dehalogenase n=1 Tax=Phytohabitans flavus TaxID=1076124 RepID=A0A6F8XZR0_9ACTN|nr:haloacid dehalogenase-like hydrolase [Phytohabitans flavus]BCB79336.1 haloacid dehalogenase [Phytohabitans flavus]
MRLVMWDVDHTLLAAGGVAQLAYAPAFTAVTGVAWQQMAFSAGRTDRDIAAETFAMHGIDDCEPHLDAFFTVFAAEFAARRELLATRGYVLPGVREVLTALSIRPHVVQTLVTGNIRPVALDKLAAFDLAGLVDFDIGGYGTDDIVRATLVRRSLERAAAKHSRVFDPAEVIVVGDTAHDVTAALANGVTAVAVATGGTSAEALAAAGAHVVLDDLSDVEAVVTLLGG